MSTFALPAAGIGRDPIDEALAASASTFRSPRMFDRIETDAVAGTVRWKPVKSLWMSAMTLAAVIGGPLFFTWRASALSRNHGRDRLPRPFARHAPPPHPPRL